MMNTPKRDTLRVSFTRSLPRVGQLSKAQASKAIHNSLQKNDRINYHTILNKLLAMQNYQKFMQLATKFIERSILQCKQQPNRHTVPKSSNINLISDGLFIHKLAELSQNPEVVLNHFKHHVKINKEPIKQLERKINKQRGADENKQQEEFSNQYGCTNSETQQQRQHRLNGYSKNNTANDNAIKDNKIIYSEYIKSNRKSMQIFQKIKQKLQNEEYISKNPRQQQKVKRLSIHQDKCFEAKAIQKLQESSLEKLSTIQIQILKFYPSIKYIAHTGSSIKDWKLVQDLGYYKNHKVCKVAIQLQQGFEENLNVANSKCKYDFPTFQHAILISKSQNNQNCEQKTNIVSDQFVRIYLTT